MIDWNEYPNFSKQEFDCKFTSKNEMKPDFMNKLQALRTEYGKPMKISSGYRDVTHPVEARKDNGGWHTKGLACDVACWSGEAHEIVRLAFKHGFTGIGISQRAKNARFIHLDMRDTTPIIYSY